MVGSLACAIAQPARPGPYASPQSKLLHPRLWENGTCAEQAQCIAGARGKGNVNFPGVLTTCGDLCKLRCLGVLRRTRRSVGVERDLYNRQGHTSPGAGQTPRGPAGYGGAYGSGYGDAYSRGFGTVRSRSGWSNFWYQQRQHNRHGVHCFAFLQVLETGRITCLAVLLCRIAWAGKR